jgi:hypothetical protein
MTIQSDFATLSKAEWLRLLVSQPTRPNLHVLCDNIEVEPAVSYLMRHSTGSLRTCRLPGALNLPANPIDAFVIHDAAAMTIAQQIELFDWMTGAGRGVQVISVTSRPLAPLVEDGRFFEGLFNLLKAVCLVTVPRKSVNRHPSRPPTSCPAIWRSALDMHA